MTTVVGPARTSDPCSAWARGWRLFRGVWWFAFAYGLALSAPSLMVSSFKQDGPPLTGATLLSDVLGPQFTSHLGLLAWAMAVGHGDRGPRRWWRMAGFVAVALAVDVLGTPWLLHSILGLPNAYDSSSIANLATPPSPGLIALASFLSSTLFATLAIVLVEGWRQRIAAAGARAAAIAAGSAARRRLLEARLAALQARVEPQFLFDTLTCIERTYAHDAGRAAGQLDRLIAYLRIALPGLRSNGQANDSTLGAEIALAEAYLAAAGACLEKPFLVHVEASQVARMARFYPMLLLPLVRHARPVEHGGTASLQIEARMVADGTLSVMIVGDGVAIDLADDEGTRLRDRLKSLYGGWAALTTEFEGDARQRIVLTVAAQAGETA